MKTSRFFSVAMLLLVEAAATIVFAQESRQSSLQNDYVDLGLSVKWAPFNIGAEKPEENGDYFAWGETDAKPRYDYDNYKFRESGEYGDVKFNKYNTDTDRGTVDGRTVLEHPDALDVVHGDIGEHVVEISLVHHLLIVHHVLDDAINHEERLRVGVDGVQTIDKHLHALSRNG
jgi:hypothetical protein